MKLSGDLLVSKLGPLSLVILLLAGACNRNDGANLLSPAKTSPAGPTVPVPTGDVSGRIESAEIATDLLTYNQDANIGFSIPVEGAIERSKDILTRWELPIPVYVDSSIVGDCAREALGYWQSAIGLTFAAVAADAESRLVIRAARSDELNLASGSGLVYRTYPNNRAAWAS
jgi:hypothetical protein